MQRGSSDRVCEERIEGFGECLNESWAGGRWGTTQ